MTKDLEEKVEEIPEAKKITEETKKPETQPAPQKIEEKKKRNPLLIIVLVLLVIALLVAAFILGTKFANKEDKENTPQQKMLDVYLTPINKPCKKGEENCELIASIPVKNKDAKFQEIYKELDEMEEEISKHILYMDKTLKLYNVETKKIQETTLDTTYDEYQFQVSYDEKEIIGLILKNIDEDKVTYSGYYDIKNKKTIIENKYDEIYPMKGNYLQVEVNPNKDMDTESEDFDWDKYWEDYKSHVLNIETEKEVITEDGGQVTFYAEEKFNNIYIFRMYNGIGETVSAIYNTDYQTLMISLLPEQWGFNEDGSIYRLEGNKVVTVNYKGEKISSTKEYPNILHIIDEYILYHDDKKVYITNDKDVNKELMEWKGKYYYHAAISGDFSEYEVGEETKPAGYYFVFEYDGSDEGKGVEIYFDPKTKESKRIELDTVGGYAKPVLYLYPEEKTEVTINFEKEDNLTTTYPKFKDEWNVTAYPNGDLYDKDGKYYYGLYWEEDSNHKVDFKEGFYVSKDNAIKFLEEKLSIIGLNEKERNEFIMYWLPILEKNEHNLVYFELTEERNTFNKIEISPKPDSLLRMAIHVKKVNGKQNIKEQKLEKFERNGFVAVEWGGILYN